MRTFLLTLMILFTISGCSIFQGLASEVAGSIVKYCTQPQDARQIVRDSINAELTPHGHTLHVHCAGDEDNE